MKRTRTVSHSKWEMSSSDSLWKKVNEDVEDLSTSFVACKVAVVHSCLSYGTILSTYAMNGLARRVIADLLQVDGVDGAWDFFLAPIAPRGLLLRENWIIWLRHVYFCMNDNHAKQLTRPVLTRKRAWPKPISCWWLRCLTKTLVCRALATKRLFRLAELVEMELSPKTLSEKVLIKDRLLTLTNPWLGFASAMPTQRVFWFEKADLHFSP